MQYGVCVYPLGEEAGMVIDDEEESKKEGEEDEEEKEERSRNIMVDTLKNYVSYVKTQMIAVICLMEVQDRLFFFALESLKIAMTIV